MISTLRQKPSSLFVLLGTYFVVQLLVRLALPASLELDEGQQLYYAQWLAAGYDSQPPIYNWIQYGFVELLGPNRLALSLLKNLMLFSSYGLVALAAAQVLKSRDLIIISCLGLLTMPQVSFESQRDLTHTVALIFCAALFAFAMLRTLKAPSAWSYALTGVAIGCGFIAKYNFALLVVAALLAVLAEPSFRRRLFDWRLLLTALIAIAIIAPHALWFFDHMHRATNTTFDKMTDDSLSGMAQILTGMRSLFITIIASAAPTLLLLLIPFADIVAASGRSHPQATLLRSGNEWSRLVGRTMLIVLVVLALMVLFGNVSAIKDRWLAPCFLLLPLYICLKVEAAGVGTSGQLPRFMAVALAIMVIVPAVLYGRVVGAAMTGRYQKQNVPYGQAIQAALAASPHRPALVLTIDQQMAGNIRLHAPDLPVTLPGKSGVPAPAKFDALHPLLVIWRNAGKPNPQMPQSMKDWIAAYPGLTAQSFGEVALPFLYGRPHSLYSFGYAVYYSTAP